MTTLMSVPETRKVDRIGSDMSEPRTICDAYFAGRDRGQTDERFLHKTPQGWEPMSMDDIDEQVRGFAGGLLALGIQPGDRVAILSYNRPEWAIADYGALTIGAASVPIYSTLPRDQVQYILQDSGAKVVVVENDEQAAKVEGLGIAVVRLPWDPFLKPISSAEHRERASKVQPDDLATLVYTSGTTGVQKGVMLTHRNLTTNMLACCEVLKIDETDLALSFLPCSHILERQVDYTLFYSGATIAYAENTDKVAANLEEVSPTVMAAVPRFFEKVYGRIQEAAAALPPKKKKLFQWAIGVGGLEAAFRMKGLPVPLGLRWKYFWAKTLVLKKFHKKVGGRMERFLSGGAPLNRDIAQFFFAMGFTVLEGYGLTETSPVLAVNREGGVKLGTVGPAIPGVELKIAPDGEILAKGPNIMTGYYKLPEATAEVLKDGWFHTGDIGELDADGYLKITDRKKDLVKTSGGKYIAPQPIENRLKAHPAIANAVLVADRRKFASVLLVPNFDYLKAHLPSTDVKSPQVRAFFQQVVDEMNASLAQYEKIKKFELLPSDFTIDSGELTPTMKVKRRKVEERYKDLIEALYQE